MRLALATSVAAVLTIVTDHFVAWTATIILASLLVGIEAVRAMQPEPLAPLPSPLPEDPR